MFIYLCAIALLLFVAFLAAIFLSLPKRLPFDPRGKHCLVTGGSRGIGKAIGAELLGAGCRSLSLLARDPEALESAKQELSALCRAGQAVHTCQVDLTGDPARIEETIRAVEQECGAPVDLVVNNAGTCLQGAFDELPADVFERQLRTNYLGAVHVTRAVVGSMKKRGSGHIAFVSSAAGQLAIWGYSAYSPSKFAVRALADALHMELLPWGIGVSILFPPNTATDGYREELRTMPEQVRAISDSAGLYQPDQVAALFVRSLLAGQFATGVGLEGWMLGVLSAAGSPEPNVLRAFVQVLLSGLFRGVSLIYAGHFNKVVERCHRKVQTNKEEEGGQENKDR